MEPQNQSADGLTQNVRGFFCQGLHFLTVCLNFLESFFETKFYNTSLGNYQTFFNKKRHFSTICLGNFVGLSYMKLAFEPVSWGSFVKALHYDTTYFNNLVR